MKNSSDTIGNRTRDLPACSAMPQRTAPPRSKQVLPEGQCIVAKRGRVSQYRNLNDRKSLSKDDSTEEYGRLCVILRNFVVYVPAASVFIFFLP
jgi:hypothetical protein